MLTEREWSFKKASPLAWVQGRASAKQVFGGGLALCEGWRVKGRGGRGGFYLRVVYCGGLCHSFQAHESVGD